jgi:hypothetical protein
MTRLSTVALLAAASSAPAVASARGAAEVAPAIPGGSWEIFGTTELSAGNGTRFAIDGGTGYFFTPMHQVGGELQLVLDNADTLELLPFYRFHLPIDSRWLVPFGGVTAGVLYQSQPGPQGGRNAGTGGTSNTYFEVGAVVGAKLMGGTHWAAVVQIGLRHAFDSGTDPTVTISAGLAVYL